MARLASATLYSAPLSSFGAKAQKKQFLTPVHAGEKVGALALTEPEPGSEASSIRTHARPADDEFVLNGEKGFITNRGITDLLLVFTVTDPIQDAKKDISAIVVPRESPGVRVVRHYALRGMGPRLLISSFGTLVYLGATSLAG